MTVSHAARIPSKVPPYIVDLSSERSLTIVTHKTPNIIDSYEIDFGQAISRQRAAKLPLGR